MSVSSEDAAQIAFEAAVALEAAAGECRSVNAGALRAEAARLSAMGELLLAADHDGLARMLGEPARAPGGGSSSALPDVWIHRAKAAAVRDYAREPKRWTQREIRLSGSVGVFELGHEAAKLAASVEDAQSRGTLPRGARVTEDAYRQIARAYLQRMGELAGPGPHADDGEGYGYDEDDGYKNV